MGDTTAITGLGITNVDNKVKVSDALEKFIKLPATQNNVESYRNATNSILTAILMDDDIDEKMVRLALSMPAETRRPRIKNAVERANNNNSTETKNQDTFTESREPRYTSHKATGLDKEVAEAWKDREVANVTYAGKKKADVYVLNCHKQHVRMVFLRNKRKTNPDFYISWTKFNEYRPITVKDNSVKTCLCPHHLRFYFFVDALYKYRRDMHSVNSIGWGGQAGNFSTCECEEGSNCDSCGSMEHDPRTVLHNSNCSVRGIPANIDAGNANYTAFDRVKDLERAECYGLNGGCADCGSKEAVAAKSERTIKKQMCEAELKAWKEKIEHGGVGGIGSCSLENEDAKFDIEVHLKNQMIDPTSKTYKGRKRLAYIPTTMTMCTFWFMYCSYMPFFYMHAWTASWQSRQLNGELGIIWETGYGYAIVNIDYAENWTHTVHDEAHSQYWQRTNSTLVPVVIAIDVVNIRDCLWKKMGINKNTFIQERNDQSLPLKVQVAIAFVSEDKLHDKAMSQRILDNTIDWIKENTTCGTVVVVSDGCRAVSKISID